MVAQVFQSQSKLTQDQSNLRYSVENVFITFRTPGATWAYTLFPVWAVLIAKSTHYLHTGTKLHQNLSALVRKSDHKWTTSPFTRESNLCTLWALMGKHYWVVIRRENWLIPILLRNTMVKRRASTRTQTISVPNHVWVCSGKLTSILRSRLFQKTPNQISLDLCSRIR